MKGNEEVVKLSFNEIRDLDLCASIEVKCADLYRQFEKLFADLPEFALLWHKTASEEDNHAQQFRLASRLRGIGMGGVTIDGVKVAEILQTIDAYITNMQKSRPSPAEALEFAIHLEDHLSEYHMTTAVSFTDAELSRLFTAMMENDQGHVTELQKALAKMLKKA